MRGEEEHPRKWEIFINSSKGVLKLFPIHSTSSSKLLCYTYTYEMLCLGYLSIFFIIVGINDCGDGDGFEGTGAQSEACKLVGDKTS